MKSWSAGGSAGILEDVLEFGVLEEVLECWRKCWSSGGCDGVRDCGSAVAQ